MNSNDPQGCHQALLKNTCINPNCAEGPCASNDPDCLTQHIESLEIYGHLTSRDNVPASEQLEKKNIWLTDNKYNPTVAGKQYAMIYKEAEEVAPDPSQWNENNLATKLINNPKEQQRLGDATKNYTIWKDSTASNNNNSKP